MVVAQAVFVRLASRPIPRVTRMMAVATERGLSPTFIGAFRAEGLCASDTWDGVSMTRIGPPLPLLNGKRAGKYITGVMTFNIALFRELWRRKPTMMHASDIETVPACLIYRLLCRQPVIFNIHDNLADRYTVPRAARAALNFIEGLVVILSSVTLVPETFRRSALPRWCQHRVHVIRNSPAKAVIAEPKLAAEGRLRILYAGWLDWGRGIAALIDLANEHPWLEIRIAGEGEPGILNCVMASQASYLGVLDHEQVMEQTRKADFVAAFYDPSRPINRAAAPNKLAEALGSGRPVLINEEVVVAQAPELSGCTIRIPYAAITSLAEPLRRMMDADANAYDVMCREGRRVYEQQYSWVAIRTKIDSIYAGLGR